MDAPSLSLDDLAHFGVKGMHWGQHMPGKGPKATPQEAATAARVIVDSVKGTVQRFQKKHGADINTARAGFAKSTPTKQAQAAKIAEAGGLHKLSDKQLKDMLSRLETEKKYSQILHEDAHKRAEGRKAVLRLLGEVGKIAAPIILGAVAAKAASGGFKGSAPFKAPVMNTKVIEGVARTLGRFPEGH